MASGPNYKVPRRRRREGKTNYHKRLALVKSGHVVLVVRKTNKYIIAQFVYPTPIGDYTLAAAHSRELVKLFGWKASGENAPAAYLTGLLAGLRARKLGIRKAIPDIGLHRPVKGAKVFAVIKGVIDAGVEIPVAEDVLPDEKRIKGYTIAEYAEMLSKSDQEAFQRQFSRLLRSGFDPRRLVEHFEEVKREIIRIYESIPESLEAAEYIEAVVGGRKS